MPTVLVPSATETWTGITFDTPVPAGEPDAGATPTTPTPFAGAAAMPATWVPWPIGLTSSGVSLPSTMLRGNTITPPSRHSSCVNAMPESRIAIVGRSYAARPIDHVPRCIPHATAASA